MTECVLTFVNTSRVYQAERALRGAGHTVGLRPLPPGVRSRCGLCVRGELAELAEYSQTLGAEKQPEAVYRSPLTGRGDWLLLEEQVDT